MNKEQNKIKNHEIFKIGKHEGPLLSEFYDWDGGYTIFYCYSCKKMHIFRTELVSDTTEITKGELNWGSWLQDYDERYIGFEKYKAECERLGLEVI
jgi:hypothetical protein